MFFNHKITTIYCIVIKGIKKIINYKSDAGTAGIRKLTLLKTSMIRFYHLFIFYSTIMSKQKGILEFSLHTLPLLSVRTPIYRKIINFVGGIANAKSTLSTK